MRSNAYNRAALLLVGTLTLATSPLAAERAQLNVLNWSELIPQASIDAFSQPHGLQLHYDILDSDDTLEAKLLAGNSGYDVVYPSSSFMVKQAKAGAYQELDWAKIPNSRHLDPALLKKLQSHDPQNKYGVPFLWGTDGMLVNVKKVQAILGADFDLNTWDLLFKPEVVNKLKGCGVSMLDSPQDVFSLMLRYLGKNPSSENPDDYQAAFDQLKLVWPAVTQVTSTSRDPITRGDLCVAMAWSGDAGVVQRIVRENKLDMDIRYITPKDQTPIWFTMMGIPKDAKNKAAAYSWINYLLDPQVASTLTAYNTYPSAVMRAQQVGQAANDGRYAPSAEEIESFYVFEPISPRTTKVMTRYWRKLATAQQ
jgi:putrescine transport system substrate-binding protein